MFDGLNKNQISILSYHSLSASFRNRGDRGRLGLTQIESGCHLLRQAAHPLHFKVDLFLLLLFVRLELLLVFEFSGLPSLFSFFELLDLLL